MVSGRLDRGIFGAADTGIFGAGGEGEGLQQMMIKAKRLDVHSPLS